MPDILEPTFSPYTDDQVTGNGTEGRQRQPFPIGDVEFGQIVQPGQPFPVYGIQPNNASTGDTAFANAGNSGGYQNFIVVKSSNGVLFGLTGYNSKSSAQFIQIFDIKSGGNTAPAEGSIPLVMFSVSASSNFSLDYSSAPRLFKSGIILCNSSTGPTKTIGSADCWFDVQYI